MVVLRERSPVAACAGALALAATTGVSNILLLWVAYQTGRSLLSRSQTAVVVGAAVGSLAAQPVVRPVEVRALTNVLATYLIFLAMPLLVGRYLAQHERLVSALDRHNRQLRWERELLTERERLRERLSIARDMHDSLGHRLSLVSVQAAALEVSDLPPPEREGVRRLAAAARSAVDELIRAVRAAHAGDAYLSPADARLVLGMVTPDRARRRREAAQRLATLAPRERQIADLVSEGLSNAEIGRRLGMSETTIKTYVSRVLAKLDCANRVQAALLVRDATTSA